MPSVCHCIKHTVLETISQFLVRCQRISRYAVDRDQLLTVAKVGVYDYVECGAGEYCVLLSDSWKTHLQMVLQCLEYYL